MSPAPRSRLAALLAGFLLLPACFQDPVEEKLELRFRADGAVEADVLVRVRKTSSFVDDEAVRERAERVREQLARDGLGWPERLARLEPQRRGSCEELVDERLVERSFRALLDDPERLERLSGESLVRWLVDETRDGGVELVILVEPGTRANRRQQELVDRHEERLAAAYLEYLEAAERLVRYLEERPERAQDLIWHVTGDESGTFVGEPPEPELDEEEDALAESVTEAMDQVLDAFGTVPEGEERALDELSRLVHDPFAYDVAIELPAVPEDVEGFRVLDEGRRLEVPRYSLTEAIESVSARWLEPDWLVVLWSGPWQDEELLLDLAELAARPRRADPPHSTGELREALRLALRPPDLLRVRWRPPAGGDQDDELDGKRPAQR